MLTFFKKTLHAATSENKLALAAVLFAFLSIATLLLPSKASVFLSYAGILWVLAGTTWIASGVLLSNKQIENLNNIKAQAKTKAQTEQIKNVATPIVVASNKIYLGMGFIVLGSFEQIAATYLSSISL